MYAELGLGGLRRRRRTSHRRTRARRTSHRGELVDEELFDLGECEMLLVAVVIADEVEPFLGLR